jgi:hypothetical protein
VLENRIVVVEAAGEGEGEDWMGGQLRRRRELVEEG